MWTLTIRSPRRFSSRDRDLIAELISEEPRHVIPELYFILHDIIESHRYVKALVEGPPAAIDNLVSVVHDNVVTGWILREGAWRTMKRGASTGIPIAATRHR